MTTPSFFETLPANSMRTRKTMTNSSPATSPAQVFAAHLLAALAKAGIRNFFLAPGARSQALAIAAGQLASVGKIDLHVRLDERSLGFTALGAALASGEPSVIITTSGTAVANLHPAVLEANHSGVPLILLTADRPHELRGVGANQTTNQVGMTVSSQRPRNLQLMRFRFRWATTANSPARFN